MSDVARLAILSTFAAVSLSLLPVHGLAADSSHASWTRYHAFNDQLQFSYPADLVSVAVDSEGVALSHSVRFHHPDVCDFEDEGWLEYLLDFHITLNVESRNCMEALKNWFPYAVTPRLANRDVFGPDSVISETYMGSFGAWNGYMVHASVEGCGSQFSFLAGGDRTVVVDRQVIELFITTWADSISTVRGVITPEKEQELFAAIIRSMSMVIPASAPPSAVSIAAKRVDRRPPAVPNVRVVSISRGFGEYGNDSTWVNQSNSDGGTIYLETSDVSDDTTPPDSLRYRVRLIEGDLPQGMILDCNATMSPMIRGRRDVFLQWPDGRVWKQDPFNFKLSVTAVDLAGNESKPSAPVTIADDGDPERTMRHIRETEGASFTRTQDRSEDIEFRNSYMPKVAPPEAVLKIEEYPLPKGAVPNDKFLKRYNSTFLGEIQADLSAWRPKSPTYVAREYKPEAPANIELGAAKYQLVVAPKNRSTALVKVLKDGVPLFEATAKHPGSELPVVTFYYWSGRDAHWVLEYWNHVVVDGVELNDRHNFQTSFFYRIVLGKPFYFAKVYDKVRVCWGNAISEQNYDEVFYAPHASWQLSPRHYENVVAFYARRDNEWYYVLAGVSGK